MVELALSAAEGLRALLKVPRRRGVATRCSLPGCNIERARGPAPRPALGGMVSREAGPANRGYRISRATRRDPGLAPCGGCRQKLYGSIAHWYEHNGVAPVGDGLDSNQAVDRAHAGFSVPPTSVSISRSMAIKPTIATSFQLLHSLPASANRPRRGLFFNERA